MGLSPVLPFSAIVAIPAHDEARLIGDCLAALAMQRTREGSPLAKGAFEVLVLANNCRDETAAVARGYADRLPFPLRVVECRLPPDEAHAGGARRVAMDLAADRLAAMPGQDGILLTTDADTRARSTWISANLSALAEGVDAVAGYVDADPAEYVSLGRDFLARGRSEDRFLALAAELEARLDPRRHDPWPNHRTHSGASFAVTLAAYRAIGGLPARPLGEDVALAQALDTAGFLIRHSLDAVVVTSCRFDSRARGGAGDTMRLRHADLDAACDDDVEPARRLFHRFRTKGLLRSLHAAGRIGDVGTWRRLPGLSEKEAFRIAIDGAGQAFAPLWREVEAAGPRLGRGQPLRPSQLPAEIVRLEGLLRRLSARRRRDPDDIALRAAPLTVSAAAQRLR